MSDWDTWLATWDTHAQSRLFRDRLDAALEVVDLCRQNARGLKFFCGMSGGKDSVAVAGLLKLAGRTDVPMVHCDTALNIPGMESVSYECAETLDMDLEVIEPDIDVWELLRSLPQDVPVWHERNHLIVRKAIAAANMLVAFTYANNYHGAFSGLRAEESRGRHMNRKIRGPIYRLQSDGTWMCNPIVDWKARDTFALARKMRLPIHPHYRLLLERFGVSPESPASRVDMALPEERVTTWPIAGQLRALYPELYRRLADARPEIRTQAI